jgi:ankyrin repeat protein
LILVKYKYNFIKTINFNECGKNMINSTPIKCSLKLYHESDSQLVVEVHGDQIKTLTIACEIFKKDNWWSKLKQFMGYTTKINVLDNGVSKQFIVKTKELTSCLNEAKSHQLTKNEALSVAARVGTLNMVKECLQPKAKINPDNAVEMNQLESLDEEQFKIAFVEAAKSGHSDVVKLLLEKVGSIDEENFKIAFIEAAKSGHSGVVKLLLQKAGSMDDAFFKSMDEAFFKGALTEALKSGHSDVVNLLLQKAGSMDDAFFKTALKNAIKSGHRDIVDLLLEKAGSMNETFIKENLKEAIESGHRDVVDLLLKKVENPDESFIKEFFVYSSIHGNKDILKIFLKKFKGKITPEIFGEAYAKASKQYMSTYITVSGLTKSCYYKPIAGCAGFLQETLPEMKFTYDQNKEIIKNFLIQSIKDGTYHPNMILSLFGPQGLTQKFPYLLNHYASGWNERESLVEIYTAVILEAAGSDNPSMMEFFEPLEKWGGPPKVTKRYYRFQGFLNEPQHLNEWSYISLSGEYRNDPSFWFTLGKKDFEIKLKVLEKLYEKKKWDDARKIILRPGVFFYPKDENLQDLGDQLDIRVYKPSKMYSIEKMPPFFQELIQNIITHLTQELNTELIDLLELLRAITAQSYKEILSDILIEFVNKGNESVVQMIMMRYLFKIDNISDVDYTSKVLADIQSTKQKLLSSNRIDTSKIELFNRIIKAYYDEKKDINDKKCLSQMLNAMNKAWGQQEGLRNQIPLLKSQIDSIQQYFNSLNVMKDE